MSESTSQISPEAALSGSNPGSAEPLPLLVAGEWEVSGNLLEVSCPAEPDVPIGATYRATPEQYERAAVAAAAARETCASLAAFERSGILEQVAAKILERRHELARLVALEAGKPLKDSLLEVERSAMTYKIGAGEAERLYGETIPLDLNERSRGRLAITRRVPVGAVGAIAPFNLPLGLTAHKLAPAFAAGCPIVLKPASATPLSILLVAEMFVEAGAPPGSISVLPMDISVGNSLVEDDRFSLLTFTGSAEVGWSMKARSGRKPVVLELGGNAALIVAPGADVETAAQRCAYGAFKHAGQLCISVQRAYVHSSLADEFSERLVEVSAKLRVGHPLEEDSDLGPMITPNAAKGAVELIDDAVSHGASVLLGGGPAEGAMLAPTILADVPASARAIQEEAFAPLVTVGEYDELDEALALVNDTPFGLQAGIFTNRLEDATRAFGSLEVGALVVNDAPTYRIDHMPYGGVKDSGLGREGLRWAIEDMTELRTLIVPGLV